ncbi:MAG: hypothetical protein E7361_04665 [Clostridiales bacterium]|nr:hypothetical protein [Clostridiales bacterium]
MAILWDKDWRYKIALNTTKRREVIDFAKTISNGNARKAFDRELSFFKDYFSIEAVISYLQQIFTDEEYNEFVKNIKANISHLLYIPKELENRYRDEISKTKPIYHQLLNYLLDYGMTKGTFCPIKKYYKVVLGSVYGRVINKLNKYAQHFRANQNKKYLKEYEVSTSLNELKKKISSNASVLNLWGKDHEIDYVLKINNKYGFGKFRSNVTSELNNVFTVNCFDGRVDENDLHIQYLTNVYPGYAHFVERQFQKTDNRSIDFGANFVINGWSTFSAWHIFPSIYTRNLKIINSKIIKLMLNTPSAKNYTQIYMLLTNTFDKAIAEKILYQITQLPGKYESRFLGAIATEIIIDLGYAMNPNNYLDRLSRADITNYFTTLPRLK